VDSEPARSGIRGVVCVAGGDSRGFVETCGTAACTEQAGCRGQGPSLGRGCDSRPEHASAATPCPVRSRPSSWKGVTDGPRGADGNGTRGAVQQPWENRAECPFHAAARRHRPFARIAAAGLCQRRLSHGGCADGRGAAVHLRSALRDSTGVVRAAEVGGASPAWRRSGGEVRHGVRAG